MPLSTKAEAFQVPLFYTALMQQSRLFAKCCGHNIKGVFDNSVQHLVGDSPADSRRALGAESREHLLLLFGALPALFPAYAGVILKRSLICSHVPPFPRIRGGDPHFARRVPVLEDFSPHVRG